MNINDSLNPSEQYFLSKYRQIIELSKQIHDFSPDYVVAVHDASVLCANILSEMFVAEFEFLGENSSNCWLAEDAFGYEQYQKNRAEANSLSKTSSLTFCNNEAGTKNILLCINEHNAAKIISTYRAIQQDWIDSCIPREREIWTSRFGHNVRVCTTHFIPESMNLPESQTYIHYTI